MKLQDFLTYPHWREVNHGLHKPELGPPKEQPKTSALRDWRRRISQVKRTAGADHGIDIGSGHGI